jgi:hypothetical protein
MVKPRFIGWLCIPCNELLFQGEFLNHIAQHDTIVDMCPAFANAETRFIRRGNVELFCCMHRNCDEEFETMAQLETHIDNDHDGDDGLGDN